MDDPRVQIIGEAANPDDGDISQLETDVVVWSPASSVDQDILISEIANLKLGETEALLLIFDDPLVIEKLIRLKLHAWGMLSPESSQTELIAAIEAVSEGLVVTNPIWLEHLSAGKLTSNNENANMVEPLTGREIEILQLMALGLTNKQIALRLGISAHTVKFHISAIFGKMGTTNRTETVKLGLKTGLILL
jgi:DNA-binding NarL/FixJ family response regulator